MALPDLADGADLSARGIELSVGVLTMVKVASALVREAAGSPILETTSTVALTGWGEKSLGLPGKPIQSVSVVEVEGTALVAAAWTLTDTGDLWRSWGWGCPEQPASVEVTMVHGLPEVPVDVVNLVCDLAVLGAASAADGAIDPRVVAEKIDDYSVTFRDGAEGVASAMTVPELTRRGLRRRFGGGVAVVSYR